MGTHFFFDFVFPIFQWLGYAVKGRIKLPIAFENAPFCLSEETNEQ
jgi:hypothetical protein